MSATTAITEDLAAARDRLAIEEAANKRLSLIANQWLGRSARQHIRVEDAKERVRRLEWAQAALNGSSQESGQA